MTTYYQTDLNKTYFIVEGEEYQTEDYQVRILKENCVSGMVDMDVRCIDNMQKYYYDISGKASLQQVFERKKPGYAEIKQLMDSLLCVMRVLKNYMVGSEGILLSPEMIFVEKEKYYFCFCPGLQGDVTKRLHELTEFLVREVDYRDEQGVHLAYVMHKATMEDHYSLEQIMREFRQELSEEEDGEDAAEVSYQSSVLPQEKSMVEEKKDFWETVRRFIEKTRMRL